MKLKESQTLIWPGAGKSLNTKTDKFWYIHYISILEKAQDLNILEAEYTILMYSVSKEPPLIHYILGDMISPIQGSSLFHDSSLTWTPAANCYIPGYKIPNEISEFVP